MKMRPCAGGCGRQIGTGCRCCSEDFPQEHDYCEDCFPGSQVYLDHMQPLLALVDRLDEAGRKLLAEVLENHDDDFQDYYRKAVQ